MPSPLRVSDLDRTVIGRLVRSADFERVLRTRTRASSAHFAVHHVADAPSPPAGSVVTGAATDSAQLSTETVGGRQQPVDESGSRRPPHVLASPFGTVWFGAVVPKRHAKRAVTRTLLKRQMRGAMTSRFSLLASGLWVIRLRAPFDRTQFPSAASEAMKRLARGELEHLLASATGLAPGGPSLRR